MRKFSITSFFKNFLNQVRTWLGTEMDKSELKIQKPAFSLIELLVAITIGSIILTLVMMSYASMVQTNLRLDEARKLQKQANFAVIRMADRIRNYSVVLPNDDNNQRSDFVSSDEGTLVIGKNKGFFEYLPSSKKVEMDGQPLFSDNVVVDVLEFDYSVENPKQQPWVQIYLKISSARDPAISNWVRTTISSRVFQ